MALKKAVMVKGYTAEYWKITKIVLGLLSARMEVELSLFKDKLTRDIDNNAVMETQKYVFCRPPEFANVARMTVYQMVGYAYDEIKKITEENDITSHKYYFNDAENVMETV